MISVEEKEWIDCHPIGAYSSLNLWLLHAMEVHEKLNGKRFSKKIWQNARNNQLSHRSVDYMIHWFNNNNAKTNDLPVRSLGQSSNNGAI